MYCHYSHGEFQKAADVTQKIIDEYISDESEKGWYLQEMARYLYLKDRVESNNKQIIAHRFNKYLLKPREGMTIEKINFVSQNRIKNIVTWIKQFEDYNLLIVQLDELLSNLSFGVKADKFEKALNEVGKILGFITERPDKECGEGPDNLWCIRDDEYIIFECKNEVKESRNEINKTEMGQMNNSCAWFERVYHSKYTPIMIIGTKKASSAAAFSNSGVRIMNRKMLNLFTKNIKNFFIEFKTLDFKNLSQDEIQVKLNLHHLNSANFKSTYSEHPVQK